MPADASDIERRLAALNVKPGEQLMGLPMGAPVRQAEPAYVSQLHMAHNWIVSGEEMMPPGIGPAISDPRNRMLHLVSPSPVGGRETHSYFFTPDDFGRFIALTLGPCDEEMLVELEGSIAERREFLAKRAAAEQNGDAS